MGIEHDFFDEDPPSSIPSNLAPGLRIAGDKYELCRRIGTGAMGEVWAARHVSLDEEVAIKVVLRDVSHGDGSSADSRFLLEARVAAQLSRKTRHIVSVTDHGQDGPHAYLVMELLTGESLEARLERTGPLPLAKVVPLVYQVARALAVAHADGVVHRDLKPSNVFVTVDEEGKALIKILDFGIAKLRASMHRVPSTDAKHSTLRGFLLGTPAYMSPEQARGKTLDHRADVWALAVIAYHLLTGAFPFDGNTPAELFARLCRVEPTPIGELRPDLPVAVTELFERAFAERIDQRFQSAVAFAGSLEHAATLDLVQSSAPRPMSPISLPPDAGPARPRATPPEPRAPSGDSSIVAAGVPRRRGPWARLVAGAAVLALLFGAATALAVRVERDAGTRHEGAARVGASDRVGATSPRPLRGAIPPPAPVAPPAPEPRTASAAAPLPGPATPSTPGTPPAAPERSLRSPPVAAPAPEPLPTATSVDRSEVF